MIFELSPYALAADYGEGVLSLDDAKAHLQELGDDYDTLIPVLRDAAVDMVERYCSLRMASCAGLVWKAEGLPARVRLGVGPVTAITGMAYLDADGTAQTGDAATLRIAAGGEVVPKPGQSWPSDMVAGIEITFTAGFAPGECPAALVQAVRMFLAHLFMNREAVSASGSAGGEVPMGFRMLCDRYRMPVI